MGDQEGAILLSRRAGIAFLRVERKELKIAWKARWARLVTDWRALLG